MIRIHRLMVLVIAGVIAVLACVVLGAQIPEPESSIGWTFEIPKPVAMSGQGVSLTPGGCRLNAADHENDEGFFNCGTFSITVPPRGIPADLLRQHVGADIEIVIRPREKRQLEQVTR